MIDVDELRDELTGGLWSAELFLTDYANFVLHFLTERYPEFNWAGERDD